MFYRWGETLFSSNFVWMKTVPSTRSRISKKLSRLISSISTLAAPVIKIEERLVLWSWILDKIHSIINRVRLDITLLSMQSIWTHLQKCSLRLYFSSRHVWSKSWNVYHRRLRTFKSTKRFHLSPTVRPTTKKATVSWLMHKDWPAAKLTNKSTITVGNPTD